MTDETATKDTPKKARAARQAARAAAGEPPRGKTAEERDLYRRVAKAVWRVQKADSLPDGQDARKEAWRADKPAMIKQARKIVQRMEKAGVTMTVADDAGAKPDMPAGGEQG